MDEIIKNKDNNTYCATCYYSQSSDVYLQLNFSCCVK